MTSAEPLISIIIPTYNYGHLLGRALDSVLAQWAADLELIVIDDGSRDNTPKVLADYQLRYPQLQAVRQENAGAAAARNHGIARAQGRYALLLDADDELVLGALATLRGLIECHPEAGVFIGAQISVFDDGRERLRTPSPVPKASVQSLARQYLLEKRFSLSHGCSLFKRELLCARPYPRGLRTGEDIPVFAYLLVTASVVTTDIPLARIHKHADSLRHQREGVDEQIERLIDEVFLSLPAQCQYLRKRYAAQRYLSLFRAMWQAGEYQQAKQLYRKAFALSPAQALRWTYVRKALRLLFKR